MVTTELDDLKATPYDLKKEKTDLHKAFGENN